MASIGDIVSQLMAPIANVGEAMPENIGKDRITDPIVNAIGSMATLPKRAMESSQRMVETGEYDPAPIVEAAMLPMGTGAIAGVPLRAGEAILGAGPIRAYHGSPHNFDAFSLDKIGTGEGQQVFGHGLYFAEKEGVAKSYRDALTAARNAENPAYRRAQDWQAQWNSPEQARSELNNWINDFRARGKEDMARDYEAMIPHLDSPNKGHMYEVNINADPEHFLDWDKPLNEQPQSVLGAIAELRQRIGQLPRRNAVVQRANDAVVDGSASGGDFMHRLARVYERPGAIPEIGIAQPAQASQALREAGVPGIKYLDQGSRGPAMTYDVGAPRPDFGPYTPFNSRADAEAHADMLRSHGFHDAEIKEQAQPQSRNYVLFDDKLVDIARKYGLGSVAALPPAIAMGTRPDDQSQ